VGRQLRTDVRGGTALALEHCLAEGRFASTLLNIPLP
jgi:hypothetical protein